MITKGISFILIATLSFAVMNALAKGMSSFHPLQVVFFRAFGTMVVLLPFMLKNNISIIGTHRKMLLLRAVVGTLSLAAFFIVLQRIPLASATSIRYLGPLFGAVFAYYFLKEKILFKQWLSFIIAFSGVLVLKGFDVRIDYLSLVLILFSAVSVGVVFVLLRYLGSKEHHLTIINYFMMTSVFFSLFFISQWRMPVAEEWLFVIGIGFFGMVGQIFMTRAFQLEETNIIAPFKYMELVYALVMGFIFFGETYTIIPFIGLVMIIFGMIMNLYVKQNSG